MKPFFFCILFLIGVSAANAQKATTWNNKQCAVVLTYDDAINIDLDNVIPALDSMSFKGTFYLIGSSDVVSKRMAEWRKAAAEGHELGNHMMFHPCDASKPGRGFVTPETDLSKYSMTRETNEAIMNNVLLKAIDGKDKRTFAYPCGDLTIGTDSIWPHIKPYFVGARGVTGELQTIDKVDLGNIDSYAIVNRDASYMIDLVKKAMNTHALLVFLFHGVGGGHNLNVGLSEHSKLLHFIKENEKNIWVAPMAEVAEFVQASQSKTK
jgi:peptidoglycan-N-acetylglucosamine deacetylase